MLQERSEAKVGVLLQWPEVERGVLFERLEMEGGVLSDWPEVKGGVQSERPEVEAQGGVSQSGETRGEEYSLRG